MSGAGIARAIGIRGGIAIILAIACAFIAWRADGLSDQVEQKRNQLANERAAHSITRQSVQTLEGALARYVGQGKAAKIAQLAAIEAQAEKSAAMRAEAAEIRSMIESIEPDDLCRTPDFVMGN